MHKKYQALNAIIKYVSIKIKNNNIFNMRIL